MQVSKKKTEFVQRLLIWSVENSRSFPWRETKNPYKILVSEHFLRKTTAKQVNDIYETFFATFQNFTDLAESPKDKIRNIIRPLGLQNQRAEFLHEISQKLTLFKGVPSEEERLLGLPGIGQYCTDAVRCLAFGKDVPMVDRNVIRVIRRVFSFLPKSGNAFSEKATASIRAFIKEFLPKGNSRSFNLALLDFAAIICQATNPTCDICPINSLCDRFINTKKEAKDIVPSQS